MFLLDDDRQTKNDSYCEKLNRLASNAESAEKVHFAGSGSISIKEAKRKIRNFVNSRKSLYEVRLRNPVVPYKEEEDVIGFLFDLEAVSGWIDSIKAYNQNEGRDSKKRIDFIRVYNCKTEIMDDDFESDILMIPVKSNLKDLYDVYRTPRADLSDSEMNAEGDDDPNDLICNSSIPCPNVCV